MQHVLGCRHTLSTACDVLPRKFGLHDVCQSACAMGVSTTGQLMYVPLGMQVVVAEMAAESGREVVVYKVRVADARGEWTVSRRFRCASVLPSGPQYINSVTCWQHVGKPAAARQQEAISYLAHLLIALVDAHFPAVGQHLLTPPSWQCFAACILLHTSHHTAYVD